MIPFSVAQTVAEAHGWKQIIIFGWDGKETNIVTWGSTDVDAAQAAGGANQINKQWDWPNYPAISAKVQALHDKIEQQKILIGELELELDDRDEEHGRRW